MEIDVYQLRWTELVQRLVNAREHSLRQDVTINDILRIMSQIEQKLPITTPQDVAEDFEEAE